MVELRSGMNTVGQNPSIPDGRDPNILRTLRLLDKEIRLQIKVHRCKTQVNNKDNYQLQHKEYM
jgi:hypothetical protein